MEVSQGLAPVNKSGDFHVSRPEALSRQPWAPRAERSSTRAWHNGTRRWNGTEGGDETPVAASPCWCRNGLRAVRATARAAKGGGCGQRQRQRQWQVHPGPGPMVRGPAAAA